MSTCLMRSVAVHAPGRAENLVLERVPTPVPAAGQVLIRVHAAGVNRPDILQRRGLYRPPAQASSVLGLEVAGTIAQLGLGSEKYWALGQPVMALCNGGGYAEYVAVPANQCMHIPQGLSFSQAATLPEVYFTVWQNLHVYQPVICAQRVLIHAAASGVGSAAIMFCKRRGAEVFATVSGAEKADFCRSLGADHVFFHQEPWEQKILDLTQGRGVDRVLDMLSGPSLPRTLSVLAQGGIVNTIAFLAGQKIELDAMELMKKNAVLTGATLRSQPDCLKTQWAKELEKELEQGFLLKHYRSVLNAGYPLEDVVKAHQHMETTTWMGKMVLNVIT